MLVNVIYLIILFLTLIFVRLRKKSLDYSKGAKIPGPFPWPVIGNLIQVRKLCRKFGGQHKAFVELAKTYSSDVINLKLGRSNVIVVSGYDLIMKILKDETFDARPWNEFAKMRNMGLRKGITMHEGPEWREMRSWLLRSLKDLGFSRIELENKIIEELVIILETLKKRSDEPVTLHPILSTAIFNVIWSLTTGKRIDNEKKLNDFLGIMARRATAFDITGGLLSIFPWIRHIAPKSCGYEMLLNLNNELKTFLMETINEHKDTYVQGKQSDLIDMFLTEMYYGKGPEAGFTDDQLLMILIDLFIAGSQTTSISMDFAFFYITLHQDVQEKLHKELDSVISHGRLPQLSDRQLLPYTEAIISESQRLRLVTPIIGPRRAINDTILGGYKIPKNSCILMNIHSFHSNSENFEDAETFKPERFIKDGAYVPDKKMIFFGAGHRRCPGEIVAKSAMFLIIAGIMRNYKLVPAPGKPFPDVEPQPGITISPKPYEVLVIPRLS